VLLLAEFDKYINRKNTQSLKWDGMKAIFGKDDLLPMWVADMDFSPPKAVLEALGQRVKHGVFGYTIATEGTRGAIVDWLKNRHGWDISPDWLLFSPGVIPSIRMAIQTFTEPGDQVLLQSPVYTPFFQMIERNGRKVCNSPLVLNHNRYEIDFADFEEKLKSGVKLFLLSSPHNPAGRVWSREELSEMVRLCKKYGVLIAADEIHADLTASPYKHVPIASLDRSAAEKVLTFMAPSKTFNLAGLQASYMVIPNAELRRKVTAALARDGFSMLNTFGQIAMEAAYRHGGDWLDAAIAYIRGNIALVKEETEKHLPELSVIEPEGTYLVWIDCRKLGLPDPELKKRLLEKGKLALNFGDAYGPGGEGFVRMNVACPREIVQEGMNRLKKAFS
jgi:cystathionine beta-lyase